MAQTYKFGKDGQWATKKGSTLAYSDTNNAFKPLPFSFERDSIATRVNKEGLVEVVGNDIPRIDYTDSTEGVLLLENSSENLVTYSEDISQSSWLKITGGSGSAPVITSNYAISPDGTQNASRVILDAGSASPNNLSMIRTNASGLSNPHSISSSFYIKSNTSDNYTLLFYNGGLNPIKVIANDSWQKIELSESVSSTADRIHLGLWDFGGILTDSYADVSIWGAQLETNSVASSYIPTNGSIIQRAAETCSDSGNSEVFNDSQGVVFANISYPITSVGSGNKRIAISDTTSSNRVMFAEIGNTGFSALITSSGSNSAYITGDVNNLLSLKTAVKYKQNDFALWINGFEVGTDTSGNTPNGLSKFAFDGGDGGNDFYGKTKEIAYYDEILTDLELEYMTSYRSLNEMVTELNLNAL